jgi:hypothetical protein
MWRRAIPLALIVGLIAAAGAGATPPTHAQAKRALAKAQQLRNGKGVKTGRELTPALQQLFAALPHLSSDDRQAARAILARPTDGFADPQGYGYKIPEATPVCDVHFCIHYVAATSDAPSMADTSPADGKPDYVEQMLSVFENEVYPCENGTAANACAGGAAPGLGWRAPASDGTLGGDGRLDVYIADLFPDDIFGYAAVDPNQSQDPNIPHHAFMVMDKDFTRFAGGSAAGGLAEERVTAAHEYNHVLQNAYDFNEDPWMFEATAVYMEDKVYPSVDDYLNYVKAWVTSTKTPLTAFPDTNLKPYGSAVWNHWLDHRFGAAVVRAAWEQSPAAGDFAPGAYSAAISAAGGTGFNDEFDRFAATVAEWDTPGAGFPDRYLDVPRDGVLPAGMQTAPFGLPHTTFAFFDVPIPAASTIRLSGTLPVGTSGAIALVGRTGTDPAAGNVTTNLTHMPSGGTDVVSLDNPTQFGRITAVVVNSDPSRSGFDPVAQDWVFTRDAGGVTLRLAQPGPPVVITGAASALADHSAVANGTLDPQLLDSSWYIEYGRTAAYGSATAPQTTLGSTVGSVAVLAPLAGLKANTTYHYRLVASNNTGPAQGADATFTTARDVTKPVVSFKVKRQRIRTVRTRGLAYLGRCSERCLGNARLTVSRAVARKLGLPLVLGKSRIALDPRPTSVTLRVRASARAKKKLARAEKSFKATLKIRVADESGNAVAVSRRVTLTR